MFGDRWPVFVRVAEDPEEPLMIYKCRWLDFDFV